MASPAAPGSQRRATGTRGVAVGRPSIDEAPPLAPVGPAEPDRAPPTRRSTSASAPNHAASSSGSVSASQTIVGRRGDRHLARDRIVHDSPPLPVGNRAVADYPRPPSATARVAVVRMVQEVPSMGGGQVLVPTVVEAIGRAVSGRSTSTPGCCASASCSSAVDAGRRRGQPDRGAAAVPGGGGSGARTSRSTSTRRAARRPRCSRSTTRCRRSVPTSPRGAWGRPRRPGRRCWRPARRASGTRCPNAAGPDPPAARRHARDSRPTSRSTRRSSSGSAGARRRSWPQHTGPDRSRRSARTPTATSSCRADEAKAYGLVDEVVTDRKLRVAAASAVNA